MRNFVKWTKKALVAGLLSAAGAAGIVVAELDWPAIIGMFFVAAIGVFFPENGPDPREVSGNSEAS